MGCSFFMPVSQIEALSAGIFSAGMTFWADAEGSALSAA